ncbi:MAG: DUF4097 family beta strand repeat-containing protein [Vicinamibacterales bacterium]
MKHKVLGGTTLCALLTIGGIAGAQPAPPRSNNNQVTVPFTDAARPGTVKVNVLSGSISVKTGTGRDVVVTTSASSRDRDDDRDRSRGRRGSGNGANDNTTGLRRLTQPAGVNIEQENNVVSISAPVMVGPMEISIEVPAATSLVLHAVNGGEVSVDGVNGSIEVNNVNGSIRLTNVGGPVIAHATNGEVVATLRQMPAGKPMSFTSFNGDVDVTLPASAKANLKMRSDRGDVYTDFDLQTMAAPPQSASDARGAGQPSPNPNPNPRPSPNNRRRDDRDDPKDRARYRLDMDRSIYGTVNGGGADFELRTFNGDVFLRKAK